MILLNFYLVTLIVVDTLMFLVIWYNYVCLQGKHVNVNFLDERSLFDSYKEVVNRDGFDIDVLLYEYDKT